jgi:HD-GYP domain-containing protein (c-di-GMP phosphodiesterase class II)
MKKELQDIFKVNLVLSSTVDSRKIASLITKFTCELMHTDACVLRLLNNSKDSLIAISSCGFTNGVIKRSHILKVNQSLSGITVKTRKPIVADDIRKESQIPESFRDSLLKEGFRSRLTVPVVFQKEVLGTITTYSKKPRHFIEEETEILSIFASQVAVAIQESKHYDDIHVNYFNTIHALALALEARDLYTRGHTERVTRYSLRLGKALQMSPEELEILRYAAEVHDIGKVSIPDFILNKPGRLTPAERAIVELHPVKGAEVLEPLEFLKPAIPIVRHHHERYDGTGYPDGLSKDRIPVMSKILACADAFDAMTSERPYRRRKLTMEEALEEIRNNSGSQFDPQVSRLFVRMIQDKLPA